MPIGFRDIAAELATLNEKIANREQTDVHNDENVRGLEQAEQYKYFYREFFKLSVESLGEYFDEDGEIRNIGDAATLMAFPPTPDVPPVAGTQESPPTPIYDPDKLTSGMGPDQVNDSMEAQLYVIKCKALKRVYGEKIIQRSRAGRRKRRENPVPRAGGADPQDSFSRIIDNSVDGQKIEPKERAFLVKSFLTDGLESAMADLYFEFKGFKDLRHFMSEMAVCPQDVEGDLTDGNGHQTDNLMYVRMNGELKGAREMFSAKNIAKNFVSYGLPVMVGAITGFGLATLAGGVAAEVAKRVTRRLVHGKFVRAEESGGSFGEKTVVSEIEKYRQIVNEALKAVKHNADTKSDTKLEQANGLIEDFDSLDNEKKNVLGVVLKSFHDSAVADASLDSNLGKYWKNEAVSKQWELTAGIAASLVAGGVVKYRQIEGALSGAGLNLDLDGDSKSHIVKYLAGSDHNHLRWFLNNGDISGLKDGVPLNLHMNGVDIPNVPFGSEGLIHKIGQGLIGQGEIDKLSVYLAELGNWKNGLATLASLIGVAGMDQLMYFLTGRSKKGIQANAKRSALSFGNDLADREQRNKAIELQNARRASQSEPNPPAQATQAAGSSPAPATSPTSATAPATSPESANERALREAEGRIKQFDQNYIDPFDDTNPEKIFLKENITRAVNWIDRENYYNGETVIVNSRARTEGVLRQDIQTQLNRRNTSPNVALNIVVILNDPLVQNNIPPIPQADLIRNIIDSFNTPATPQNAPATPQNALKTDKDNISICKFNGGYLRLDDSEILGHYLRDRMLANRSGLPSGDLHNIEYV